MAEHIVFALYEMRCRLPLSQISRK